MVNPAADLRFGYGNSQGFTPAGIAAYDDLRPAAVVRELIQNGLDAARIAEEKPAVVEFRLTEVWLDDIPGIERYRKVLDQAVETQQGFSSGVLAEPAKLVVERIVAALDRESVPVLTVFDNGVGLNEKRMTALLSDGVSLKGSGSTGTYGNGHQTAIPASDLRYVLYGGITADGARIGAGHAVLASYKDEEDPQPSSGDGFYVRGFRKGRGSVFSYATGEDLPDLIVDTLGDVEERSGRGSAVIIPAFNGFAEEDDVLWNMVFRAASASFFPAIADGRLEVIVDDRDVEPGGARRVLDKHVLPEVLNSHRDNRRTRNFLNGRRAFEAHNAFERGRRDTIRTGAGDVEVRLLETGSGPSRVDLCRNGMWITDKVPGFANKFTDKVPFHAVLLLDAGQGRKLHDLIRDAEGPLHDAVLMKHLRQSDRRPCRNALGEIVQWILENTTSLHSDSYTKDDFLTLDFGGDDLGGAKRAKRAFWGPPALVNGGSVHHADRVSPRGDGQEHGGDADGGLGDGGKDSGHGDGGDGTPDGGVGGTPEDRGRSDRGRARPSLPSLFQAVSRPVGKNRRRILIECRKVQVDAELRVVVDEAIDETCDRPAQDAYAPVSLQNVKIDGDEVDDAALVRWKDEIVGVRLGVLRPGEPVEVDLDYQLTGDFSELPNPSLRVEVFKTDRRADRQS